MVAPDINACTTLAVRRHNDGLGDLNARARVNRRRRNLRQGTCTSLPREARGQGRIAMHAAPISDGENGATRA